MKSYKKAMLLDKVLCLLVSEVGFMVWNSLADVRKL